ncbi:hypothetical protein ALC60_13063, partial [Trachymyrmex zeteki]
TACNEERQRERTDEIRCRFFTSSGFNIDGDTLGGSSFELHEDGGEGRVDNEGDQEEEGEEAEGAEEDEERGRVKQQLLQKRLLLLFVRHLGEQTAVLVSCWILLSDVVSVVAVVVVVVVVVVAVVLGVLAARRQTSDVEETERSTDNLWVFVLCSV